MLLVSPDPATPELARTLDLGGYSWKATSTSGEAGDAEPDGGWAAAIVDVTGDAEGAWALLRALRKQADEQLPVMVLIGGAQLSELEHRDDLFDDFCLAPFHPSEFEARLRHLLSGDIAVVSSDVVEYGSLTLNLETYQAAIGNKPLDMTYMEYELLKFLAQNPGKVFTREILLSRVWGVRVLRWCPHSRCPCSPASGQARRGTCCADPNGSIRRLPLRRVALGELVSCKAV